MSAREKPDSRAVNCLSVIGSGSLHIRSCRVIPPHADRVFRVLRSLTDKPDILAQVLLVERLLDPEALLTENRIQYLITRKRFSQNCELRGLLLFTLPLMRANELRPRLQEAVSRPDILEVVKVLLLNLRLLQWVVIVPGEHPVCIPG